WLKLEDESILVVNIAQVADYSLFTGRDLEAEELNALKHDAQMSELRARALRILGERNMSKKQITDSLIKKGATPEEAASTADWLESIGAIDDAEFSKLIVRHYAAKKFGVSKIRDELYRRGIPRDLWEDALSEMSDMEDAAFDFVSQKLRGAEPDRDTVNRVTAAAYRRGFSWDEISAAISRYRSEYEET
ncbi:MAG: regulatory protein RecX, partial [Oscillospiraceae bacterium]|nr:regulatory protein RecX [Oscillospiraceae bacterium]